MKKLTSQLSSFPSNSLLVKLIAKFTTVVAVFISRFGGLPANFSPLGSFGFFGGSGWLCFGSIVLFDAVKGGFYKGYLFTYLGFGAYFLLGKLAHRFKNAQTQAQILLLPVASFLFFLMSNFGVWWYWYPHTLEGLQLCYLLALPFYTRTLMGDLVFGYSFIMIKKLAHSLKSGTIKFDDSFYRTANTSS